MPGDSSSVNSVVAEAWHIRLLSLVLVGACIALGLASRLPGAVALLGKYPGDVLWAAMVFFGWGLLLPRLASRQRLALALASAWGIECLKRWQAPWLVELRHTTVGHLVLGQVFSWQNLVAYALGILLAPAVARLVEQRIGGTS